VLKWAGIVEQEGGKGIQRAEKRGREPDGFPPLLTLPPFHTCRYRKPRNSYKFMRPELQQRTAAFKKGSAYLERYCMFITFAFYLEHVGPETSE
jgi:hypothetical protein